MSQDQTMRRNLVGTCGLWLSLEIAKNRVASGAEVDLSSSAPRGFLENPLNHARADAELLADLVNAIAFVPQLQYAGFDRWLDAPASQLHAIRPGARQPGIDPFANDSP